ncbi:MAG: hypothetical protein VB131_00035 [Burkholderia gladioli]
MEMSQGGDILSTAVRHLTQWCNANLDGQGFDLERAPALTDQLFDCRVDSRRELDVDLEALAVCNPHFLDPLLGLGYFHTTSTKLI